MWIQLSIEYNSGILANIHTIQEPFPTLTINCYMTVYGRIFQPD